MSPSGRVHSTASCGAVSKMAIVFAVPSVMLAIFGPVTPSGSRRGFYRWRSLLDFEAEWTAAFRMRGRGQRDRIGSCNARLASICAVLASLQGTHGPFTVMDRSFYSEIPLTVL